MNHFAMAWRQTKRDFAAGEIRLMVFALILAVLAVTAVGMITDRAAAGLQQEAGRLIGGDLVLRADTPIDTQWEVQAKSFGLTSARTASFPSMVQSQNAVQLCTIRALSDGFPLRGAFVVKTRASPKSHDVQHGPRPGSIWLSEDAIRKLNANLGDSIQVGDLLLKLEAVVVREADASFDYFDLAPKVFIAFDDLHKTNLAQSGSRIQYRFLVAGDVSAVSRFRAMAEVKVQRGQRFESAKDGRPEVRSALERAGEFLSVSALVSLILASIAIALAARRHAARHLDASAVMRCMGASQATIARLQVGELFFLGLIGSSIGIVLAYGLQWVVGDWLSQVMKVSLPNPTWGSVLSGYAIGFVVLFAFATPSILALRNVPALRVLRRDIPLNEPSAWLVGTLGLMGLMTLLWWKSGSPEIATIVLGGLFATVAVLALLGMLLLFGLRLIRQRLRGPWRYGLANLTRHRAMTLTQIAALGLGLMALLLLVFVRTDLLSRWQQSLPADAPNRFLINAQADQLDAIAEFVKQQGMNPPELYPMVRARLFAVNGKDFDGTQYGDFDARSRRLAEREFNLSYSSSFRSDNTLLQGRYWEVNHQGATELSVEEDFAKSLKWKLGDEIVFDVAGEKVQARVTSIRKVDWESFKPNFFVVLSPGALQPQMASYISALHVPANKLEAVDDLVRTFPNLSVIDLDAVLAQVRSTITQVTLVIEAVFYFSLIAGLLVMVAAVQASQDERQQESGVMRVLGASTWQLRMAQLTEFASLGLLSGSVAAIAAGAITSLISTQVFDLSWQWDFKLLIIGTLCGTLLAIGAGMFANRKVTQVPPMQTLRGL